jgi:hypothetical protein
MTTFNVINTAPEYDRNVMHDGSRPWAVAEMEYLAHEPRGRVIHIVGRFTTLKGAKQAKNYRIRQEQARRAAIRAECEKPVPYGC